MLAEQSLILLIYRINNSFRFSLLKLFLFYALVHAVKSIDIGLDTVLEMCTAAWLENGPRNGASNFVFIFKWDLVSAAAHALLCSHTPCLGTG